MRRERNHAARAYGDLTTQLAKKCSAENGTLDVVDVLPI